MNVSTTPAPVMSQSQEEWPETDFDLPDGNLFSPSVVDFNREDDLDVDMELDIQNFETFSRKGGTTKEREEEIIIHLPIRTASDASFSQEHDEDDEGVSTIKVSALTMLTKTSVAESQVEDDFESSFTFPSELEQLSSRPFSLSHLVSKVSMEWGDKDHTSSSTSSSETYSSLGFGIDAFPSTNSTATSLTGTDDENEGELEGLILPFGLFDSSQGQIHFERLLERKKKLHKLDEQLIVANDPEDDFEVGLVINNDSDFSPSKLLRNVQRVSVLSNVSINRSRSMPARSVSNRPSFRKNFGSTLISGISEAHQRVMSSMSRRGYISQSQTVPSITLIPTSSSNVSKANLRGQKSHSGLKASSLPLSQRRLGRKASLSSLIEASYPRGTGQNEASAVVSKVPHGSKASTTASSAKMQLSTSRSLNTNDRENYISRPSTPLNTSAVRSTLPTISSRPKSRTPMPDAFSTAVGPAGLVRSSPSAFRSVPPEKHSLLRPSSQPLKVLRRPRHRLYGDGTELDGIEDLPTDRDKEARFRIKPKPVQQRSITSSDTKCTSNGASRMKRMTNSKVLDPTATVSDMPKLMQKSFKFSLAAEKKSKPSALSPKKTIRKPTLIRGLGSSGVSKVIEGMRWNPQILCWEGNDQVLRDFDAAIGTSIRPALITHLTGSSVGSPINSFRSAVRIVGNMIFDPVQMCWMSTLPPEEDEPDVFADLADDEYERDASDNKGDTIRARLVIRHTVPNPSNTLSDCSISDISTPVRSRSLSESESDRGSRASLVCHVDDSFSNNCHAAEIRHRAEMKGWSLECDPSQVNNNRSNLYEIRALATRQY